MRTHSSTSHDVVCYYGDNDDASPIGYELNGQEVDLVEILRELSESPRAQRYRRKVEWEKNYDPDAPPAMA